MKTQSIFRVAVAATLLTSSLLFIQCKGSQGEPGPQGATGATGERGATGNTGPKGETGTANVIYSNWIGANWNSLDNPTKKVMTIESTRINQNSLDRDLIMVYCKQWGTSEVYALPTNGRWGNVLYSFSLIVFNFSGFLIEVKSTDGHILNDLETSAIRGNRFRYVIIPGSIPAGRKAAIDYSNYEAVKKAFNIPD